ncbi:MAG: hypothetical protein IKM43_01955 [Clostridia bacterium]|nr:hypothetical protein [Clostridia bacterium]
MEIVYVAGGSYKSFYLNYFLRLNKCDLIIFNFGIFYDLSDKIQENTHVFDEIKMISKKLSSIVVACVYKVKNKQKRFIVCNADKICEKSTKKSLKYLLNQKIYEIGLQDTIFTNHNKILITKNNIYPNILSCSKHKIYMFCDKFGATVVQNKKLKRKFCKYSKFILK